LQLPIGVLHEYVAIGAGQSLSLGGIDLMITVKIATLYATIRVELNTDVAVQFGSRWITNHGQRQQEPVKG
jgi:hypothetical protein